MQEWFKGSRLPINPKYEVLSRSEATGCPHAPARHDPAREGCGLIENQTCEIFNTRQAFQYAIYKLKTNRRTHLAFYLVH